MLFEAYFFTAWKNVHLIVTFRESVMNSHGCGNAAKGSLLFIYALWMGMGEVGLCKYCEEFQLRMWCPSQRERIHVLQ